MSYEDALGERLAPEVVREKIALFDWRETFLKASIVASVLANSTDRTRSVREIVVDPLARLAQSNGALERTIGQYVSGQASSRPLAHEGAIYFLQALAVLYGMDDGPAPNDETVALFLLAANDYVTDLRVDETRSLTRKERLAVDTARAALFNQRADPVRLFVRAYYLFSARPPRRPEFPNSEEWRAFQEAAFGMSLENYIEHFVGPAAMMSTRWGQRTPEGKVEPPIVRPKDWFKETLLPSLDAELLFGPLSCTREHAREQLRRGLDANGLPTATAHFQRVPFIRFDEERLVAASPWALHAQMKNGLWARHLQQAKAQFGDGRGAVIWTAAFGDLVELWCRQVARVAEVHSGFRGANILSVAIGEDEIEDVVHVDGKDVVLFSVKARMVREDKLRTATSRAVTIDWYEEFLFGREKGTYREGALRLLDRKCTNLRAGEYEPAVPRQARIHPVVVTFDDIGDTFGIYAWVRARCNELGLFRQARVDAPTFMTVNEFEALMASAAHGHRIARTMRCKSSPKYELASFAQVLRELVRNRAHHRLPEIERWFDEITERMAQSMFGKSLPSRSNSE